MVRLRDFSHAVRHFHEETEDESKEETKEFEGKIQCSSQMEELTSCDKFESFSELKSSIKTETLDNSKSLGLSTLLEKSKFPVKSETSGESGCLDESESPDKSVSLGKSTLSNEHLSSIFSMSSVQSELLGLELQKPRDKSRSPEKPKPSGRSKSKSQDKSSFSNYFNKPTSSEKGKSSHKPQPLENTKSKSSHKTKSLDISDFSEVFENENRHLTTSTKFSILQRDLQAARRARAAFEHGLKMIQGAKARQKEAQKKIQREKHTLAKALEEERAKRNTICVESKLMRKQAAALQKSQKEQQHSYERLRKKMTSDQEEYDKVVKNLNDEILSKNKEIESLHILAQSLRVNREAKDEAVEQQHKSKTAACQQKLNHLCRENQKLASENQKLREDAFSYHLKYKEKLELLTQKNLQTTAEIERLRDKLEAARHERRCVRKQHQEDKDVRRRLEEKVNAEKVRCQRTSQELETLKRAIPDAERERQRNDGLEEALHQQRLQNAALQNKVDHTECALEKERANSERYRAELQGMKEEQRQLSEELQKAQKNFVCFQAQCQAELEFQGSHVKGCELRLKEQKVALNNVMKALLHMQQEYTDLGRRHSEISSMYRQLLKEHGALQNKYERLCYAKGMPRPEFSVSHLYSAIGVKGEPQLWFS